MYDTLSCMRFLLILTLAASLVCAAELPVSAPEQSGFSRERIHRINTLMQEHVMAGDMVGASGLLARDGKIVFLVTARLKHGLPISAGTRIRATIIRLA